MIRTFLFLALFSTSLNFAQVSIIQNMSQGNQPGIKIFIADVSEENIEDAIKEITKSYGGKNKKI